MANHLHRYWFRFEGEPNDLPPGVGLGCGVTACKFGDALGLLRARVFAGALPTVTEVIEDVDVSTLDPGHVLPNMAPPGLRGIWFPLGYGDV